MLATVNFFRRGWTFFQSLIDAFGWRFVAFILIIEMLLQGLVFGGGTGGFIGAPIFFLFRLQGLTASRMQILKTISTIPWAMKSLFGIISDVLYWGGYNRMPYMFITLIGAALSSTLIASLWPLEPEVFTVLLSFIFLSIAVNDLLLEAMYAEKGHIDESLTPKLVSFYHMATALGEAVSIGIIGLFIVNLPLHYIYLFPVPIFLFTLLPIYYNWLGEQERVSYLLRNSDTKQYRETYDDSEKNLSNLCGPCCWFQVRGYYWPFSRTLLVQANEELVVVPSPVVGVDLYKIREHRKPFLLAVFMGLLSLGVSVIALFHIDTFYLFVIAIAAYLSVCCAFLLLVERRTAKFVCYAMTASMFTIAHESASFLFYTDSPEQYPEGPHFSVYFYVTGMGLLGCAVATIGTWLYNLFLSEWRYRSVFYFGNVLSILFSLSNAVFYKRWNLLIGIPDYVFVLGSETCQIVTLMWVHLPASNMMIKLCPPGIQATMYALLAGSMNLGRTLAHYQSAFILDQLNITPSGALNESQKFEWLWLASLISSVAACFPLVLIHFLIPDALQTEPLVDLPAVVYPRASDDELIYTDSMSSDDLLELQTM